MAKGMAAKMIAQRMKRMQQSENSVGATKNQGRPGKPPRMYPGGPVMTSAEHAGQEKKHRETGDWA